MSITHPVVAAVGDGSGGGAVRGATVVRPPEARATLAIVEAQYRRAVARALASDSGDRAGAFAEAHRLLQAAVALRRTIAPEDGVVSDAGCRACDEGPAGRTGAAATL